MTCRRLALTCEGAERHYEHEAPTIRSRVRTCVVCLNPSQTASERFWAAFSRIRRR
jgi:hypothetical protein